MIETWMMSVTHPLSLVIVGLDSVRGPDKVYRNCVFMWSDRGMITKLL